MSNRPDHRVAANAPSRVGFAFGLLDALAVPGPILIPLLGHLGTAEPAARQLISRLAGIGHLTVERHGRIAVYALAGSMLRRYRMVGDPAEPLRWQGSFHAVIHDIPQTRRRIRERLLSAAAREGLGQYRPGLLLGCRDPRPWLDAVLTEGDSPVSAPPPAAVDDTVEVGRLAVGLPVARRMAQVVWDYPGLRRRVEEAVARLDVLAQQEGGDAWAHARRVHDAVVVATPLWLTCADIAVELLPDDLGLDRTQHLVGAVGRASEPYYGSALAQFVAASSHRHLIRLDPDRRPRH